jgi:hypothetical protein
MKPARIAGQNTACSKWVAPISLQKTDRGLQTSHLLGNRKLMDRRSVEPLHDLQRKGGEGATGGVKDETNVGYACPTHLKHHP